jgi:hypothetical protein
MKEALLLVPPNNCWDVLPSDCHSHVPATYPWLNNFTSWMLHGLNTDRSCIAVLLMSWMKHAGFVVGLVSCCGMGPVQKLREGWSNQAYADVDCAFFTICDKILSPVML